MSCPKSCQDKHEKHEDEIACVQRRLDAKISRKGTLAFVLSLTSILAIFATFGYSRHCDGEDKIKAKTETHAISIMKITTQLESFEQHLDGFRTQLNDLQKSQNSMAKKQFTKEELAFIVIEAIKHTNNNNNYEFDGK